MRKKKLSPSQIYQLLPRTNCKLCGCMSCNAFAFLLVSGKKKPADCPELQKEGFRFISRLLDEAFAKGEAIQGTEFIIDRARCTGCGDCVVICPRASRVVTFRGMITRREEMPPVFQVIDGTIQVINWSSCKRTVEGADICNVCVEKCPFSALELVKD